MQIKLPGNVNSPRCTAAESSCYITMHILDSQMITFQSNGSNKSLITLSGNLEGTVHECPLYRKQILTATFYWFIVLFYGFTIFKINFEQKPVILK